MKKYIALILALLMAMFCMTGCGSKTDDTVMTVGDSEVSWDEFMYWLGAAASELESYYSSSAGTGVDDWQGDCMFDKSVTNAEWCVRRAKETTVEIHSVDMKAREMGVTVTDEDHQTIEEQIQSYKEAYCTSDDVDAEFEEILNESGLTLESYKSILELNMLYYNVYKEMYGENGEKLDDERLQKYAEDNGYVASAHILFRTVETDENGNMQYDEDGQLISLSDEEIAEKTAQAEAVAKELQSIADDTERYDTFIAKMGEISEDPGKASFPNGYCFTSGTMVESYDSTSRALDVYAVSDPVASDYGLHVIMRVPITGDSLVTTQSGSSTMAAIAAPEYYAQEAEGWSDGFELKVCSGYTNVDFTQFFDEDGFSFVSFAEYKGIDTEEKADSQTDETADGQTEETVNDQADEPADAQTEEN